MRKFKNTTFREGYKPTFPEFKKSHANLIALGDMEEAFKAVTDKNLTKKEKDSLLKELNGNTTRATSKSSEGDVTKYN